MRPGILVFVLLAVPAHSLAQQRENKIKIEAVPKAEFLPAFQICRGILDEKKASAVKASLAFDETKVAFLNVREREKEAERRRMRTVIQSARPTLMKLHMSHHNRYRSIISPLEEELAKLKKAEKPDKEREKALIATIRQLREKIGPGISLRTTKNASQKDQKPFGRVFYNKVISDPATGELTLKRLVVIYQNGLGIDHFSWEVNLVSFNSEDNPELPTLKTSPFVGADDYGDGKRSDTEWARLHGNFNLWSARRREVVIPGEDFIDSKVVDSLGNLEGTRMGTLFERSQESSKEIEEMRDNCKRVFGAVPEDKKTGQVSNPRHESGNPEPGVFPGSGIPKVPVVRQRESSGTPKVPPVRQGKSGSGKSTGKKGKV